MTQEPNSPLSEEAARELLLQLRRKEGHWVQWGHACQQLQQAGYLASAIFEETGFEASQQNLVIVAAQVYESLAQAGMSEEGLAYYQGPRSDVLYEFRLLNQSQRSAAASFAMEKQLDVDEAKEAVRAIKEFARLSLLPEGFSRDPGDAVAFQCWQRARGKKDLQERSRLIAKGLKFASSPSARAQIERLLSDFTVVPTARAPMLPLYRPEEEEELSRIIPVAGEWPLERAVFEAVPQSEPMEPFGRVRFSGTGSFLPVPGWQAILKAADPVAILGQSDRLPGIQTQRIEPIVVIVDRRSREWDANGYFLIERENQLEIEWFPVEPQESILGQVVLILRPKRILDEGNLTQPWQMDD
ncbi:MAG: RuBisCO accumulation factor 1 [Cyanobacteriota bacterium]|nr:RuBisCO accumulation factor 1 [Cyanobacteriota bacterium]